MSFSREQLAALHSLARIWAKEQFVLIGASALNCLIPLSGRQTHDLDMVLAVSMERYPAGLDEDPQWSQDTRREHTWIGPHGVQVDVLPVMVGDEAATTLLWPKSGQVMSTLGLRLTLKLARLVRLTPDLEVRVAPLEVLALLKMVAYLDRPYDRERDLGDIAHILDEFIEEDDPRRYSDEVVAMDLDFDQTSPFLLGKRLAEIVGPEEGERISQFIEQVSTPGTMERTQARMLTVAPPSWRSEPGELIKRFEALESGFRSKQE